MSFQVSIERIERIWPHPNADRLELTSLAGKGYQLIVPRGRHQPGEEVLLFPLDALLPPALAEQLGVAGKLAGSKHNRVKTVRLRGEISQGLLGPVSLLGALLDRSPAAITAHLGVTKFEPREELDLAGTRVPLPPGQSVYDIESADESSEALATLMDQPVHVTEKIEGRNLAVSLLTGRLWVCQRNFAIEPAAGQRNVYWEVAERDRLTAFARHLGAGGEREVSVYAELIGPKVQGNYYGSAHFRSLLFDIKIDRRWVPPDEFRALARAFFGDESGLVPLVVSGLRLGEWLAGRSVRTASEGTSQLAPVAREGIVIRPQAEQFSRPLRGRLILKQRAPNYLAETDG